MIGLLKKCPQCYTKLQTEENAIQVCKMCGCLVKSGTLRPEVLLIQDSIILQYGGVEDERSWED